MDITPAVVRELLDYNPANGVLTWRKREQKWFETTKGRAIWNGRYAGKRAGRVRTDVRSGYQSRVIGILGRGHPEHRLAWMWMTDDPVPEFVDHKNQDATDNRWVNLRASSCLHNNRNCSLRKSNTSGVTGVSWNSAAKRWIANVRVDYKLRYLGSFSDMDEAARAVEEFRAANGFDKNHGKHPAHYRA